MSPALTDQTRDLAQSHDHTGLFFLLACLNDWMNGVMGEPIGEAHMPPPFGCAHAQSGFVLVDHVRFH
jgi:hypothetical protein